MRRGSSGSLRAATRSARPLLCAVAVGIVFAALLQLGLFSAVDVRAADVLQGGLLPPSDIAIVAIDESSLEALGQYPWSRAVHAQLIDRLVEDGVRAIAYDVGFFGEAPGSEELEQAVADAQAAGIPVLMTSEIVFDVTGSYVETVAPFAPFGAQSGYSNLLMDADGVVRRLPLRIRTDDDREGSVPFSVMVARAVGTPVLPADDTATIRYLGPPGTLERVSFSSVLAGGNTGDLHGKIVFVGVTAPDLHDEYLTPVSRGRAMPGVEIHANAFAMIRSRAYLAACTAPWAVAILLALLGGLAIWAPFARIRKPALALIGLLLPPLYLVVVVLAFSGGTLLPPITPLIAYVLGAGAAFCCWVFEEQWEKRHLRRAFEKYVSPAVIRELLKDPSRIALGGQRKELTILFSDIRGFTSLSEKMDPETLVAFMNEYLTSMASVVQEEDGLVDKYIGDAVMALWNAPLDQERHAERACRAALKMIAELGRMQHDAPDRFSDLRIGIGVHTGEAVVGNMGSEERFDYTAIGDSVNLASRLEGMTKCYGVDIIISDETRKLLKESPGDLEVRKLDRVCVKGKRQPVTIYELIRNRTRAHALFERGLERYLSGEWKEAAALFRRAEKAGDTPSKLFLERIDILRRERGGRRKAWDGVWTHESK